MNLAFIPLAGLLMVVWLINRNGPRLILWMKRRAKQQTGTEKGNQWTQM